MTVKTTKLGGSDWTNGEVLYAADLNDSWFGFLGQVAGSGVTNTTTETSSAKITISANKVKYGILIMAGTHEDVGGTGNITVTFRLRFGTNATTPASNSHITSTTGKQEGGHIAKTPGSLIYFHTGADWSVDNYVDVSVQPETAASGCGGNCTQMVIMYF